jgi:hypothetical protein
MGMIANNAHERAAITDISKMPFALELAFSSDTTLIPMNFDSMYPTTWKITIQDLYGMPPKEKPS